MRGEQVYFSGDFFMETSNTMNSDKKTARIFGIFFLTAFVAYGLGSGLLQSILNSPDTLINIQTHKGMLIFGVILMSAVHTFFNTGMAVIMLPTLKNQNKTLAYGYLSAAITTSVLLIVGGIFLLLLLPLSDEFVKSGSANSPYFETLNILCKKGNFFSYQIAMAIWGIGGLMFCNLLYTSKIVPKLIAVWGFTGYIIFISGAGLAISGYAFDVFFDAPGGLFEIFISLWVIIKGFSPAGNIPLSEKINN